MPARVDAESQPLGASAARARPRGRWRLEAEGDIELGGETLLSTHQGRCSTYPKEEEALRKADILLITGNAMVEEREPITSTSPTKALKLFRTSFETLVEKGGARGFRESLRKFSAH